MISKISNWFGNHSSLHDITANSFKFVGSNDRTIFQRISISNRTSRRWILINEFPSSYRSKMKRTFIQATSFENWIFMWICPRTRFPTLPSQILAKLIHLSKLIFSNWLPNYCCAKTATKLIKINKNKIQRQTWIDRNKSS